MPVYRYKARNRDHYIITDIMEAVDKGDCVRKLKMNDMVPLDVTEIKLASFLRGKDIVLTSGISKQDLVFFLSQFYNLLNAGLSIIESLKIIIDQSSNKYLKKYLIKVLQDIRNGSSLYGAMARQKKAFPKLLVEMIRVGEVIGNLPKIVLDLHNYYKKQTKTISDIKSALTYPIFLILTTIVVTIIMMFTVVPAFKNNFAQMGRELPTVTRIVISISSFFQSNFFYILLSILLFIFIGLLYNKNIKGKRFFGKLILKMPIFGSIARKSNLIHIARTYSTLLNNSVNAIDGLEITKNIINNQIYIDIIDKALINIQNGIPIHKAFEKQWSIDPVFVSMLTIGEETASIDTMLGSIAEYYDNEMSIAIERLNKLMEPVIIVFMALVVGTIVLAILLPMLGMMDGGFN